MGMNSCLDMCCCNEREKLQQGVNSRRHRRQWGNNRSVQMKVQKLQSVVPGSHGLQVDQLLVHTADYISHLGLQISVLEALIKLQEP